MKTYTIALLAASVAATTWEQDVAIAGGVLYGIVGADHLDDLENCMTDADIFSMALIHAFKLATFGDLRSLIAGYRLVVDLVRDFPGYIHTCEQTGDDWVALGKWFDIFIHPVGLVERVTHNLTHNFLPIVKDTLQAH